MGRRRQEDTPAGLDAELLLRLSARWLLADPDPERYMRRLAEQAPTLFAGALADDTRELERALGQKVLRAEAPQFFRSLGWAIVSAMPLPSTGWKPQRMPLPGRNDPCLCGSGARFAHCCQRLVEHAPRLEPEMLAAYVVEAMPARDWARLPASQVPPRAVAAVADDLREHGRERDALRLLEPWANAPAPWPAARVDLLDTLADLYLETDQLRRRRTLVDAMIGRGDAAVQSLGWQRRSMMAVDDGDEARAREAFERAQRLTPDDPRVALLEVTTLLSMGEIGRAHERAAFHARRLARLPDAAAIAHEIEALEAIARGELDDAAAGARGEAGDWDDDEDDEDDDGFGDDEFGDILRLAQALAARHDALAAWLRALPPPTLRLDLSRAGDDDLGELAPQRDLHAALARWRVAMGDGEARRPPADMGEALRAAGTDRWEPVLRREPALADSFEVLDSLARRLDGLPFEPGEKLQQALVERARGLWTLLRARYPRAGCQWGWTANRPALRLLQRFVVADRSPRADASFEWLRALVEVLDADDHLGLRDHLGTVLLRRGDAAGALALAERYPDDFAGIRLLHARALLELRREAEAQEVFASALKANPHLLALLRSRRAPRLPAVDACRVGSREQARIVVAEQHDLWRGKPLQAWLKSQDPGPGDAPGPVQLTLT